MFTDEFKLIRSGRMLDGRGGLPIDNAAVLVRGSSIVAVGRQIDVVPPDGTAVEVFDFPDSTVMPGMVDCHTHHNGFGDGRVGDALADIPDEVLTLQSARNARIALFSGVTSIRENGPKNNTMFRLRDAIREGKTVGPRMVLCGRAVSIIGGHLGYFGGEVTGPVEARAMTRRLIKDGADYIKITATGGTTATSFPLRPSFEVDELTAITSEAHKFGKLTATHCVSTQGIINSLDADVDMIIHSVFKDADGTNRFREDVAERIGAQGAYVNPTLHVFRSKIWALERKKAEYGLSFRERSLLDEDRRQFDTRMEHCRRMIDMGLKVITGSDSSWGDYMLGNTVYEVECLRIAGYSDSKALASVTGDAASALGIEDEVGTLQCGKQADMIVIDGNPAQDIDDLWNVTDVLQAGEWVNRGSDESRDAVRQMPP